MYLTLFFDLQLFCSYDKLLWTIVFTDDNKVVSFTHDYSSLPAAVAQHFCLLLKSAIPEALLPLPWPWQLSSCDVNTLQAPLQVKTSSLFWFPFGYLRMWSLSRILKAEHTTVWKTAWKLLLEASMVLQETGCLWGQVSQHL